MCYAYVLGLTVRKKDKIPLLDWGGGSGHYYVLARALLPDLQIDYHCYDVPRLCQLGRQTVPQGEFYDNQDIIPNIQYDLVLASSSLQYFEDWQKILFYYQDVQGLIFTSPDCP
jgi:putative methyltransferase (TIGR04325 family)